MLHEWLQTHGQPDHGKIRRLVFLAAHALGKGESFLSGRNMPNLDINEVPHFNPTNVDSR